MRLGRDGLFATGGALLVVALAFLLLRENDGRVRAEAKVRDQALRLERFTNEQGRTISSLETENSDLELRLKETILRYEEQIGVQAADVQRISADLDQTRLGFENEVKSHETTAKERDARIATLDSEKRRAAEIHAGALKKKNDELADFAAQVQQASTRYEKLLAKNRALESDLVDSENRAERFRTDLKKLELENAYLTRAAASRAAAEAEEEPEPEPEPQSGD